MGAYAPLPNPTAIGTFPTIAVIGAAVATAMNNTPIRPTALGLSRCILSGSVVVPTGGSMVSLTEDPFSVFGLVLLVLRDRRSLMWFRSAVLF